LKQAAGIPTDQTSAADGLAPRRFHADPSPVGERAASRRSPAREAPKAGGGTDASAMSTVCDEFRRVGAGSTTALTEIRFRLTRTLLGFVEHVVRTPAAAPRRLVSDRFSAL
jgi:hypothetical protein